MNKLIIFDMDGTLYDLDDVVQMSYDMQVQFLCMKKNILPKQAVKFLTEHHVYPVMKKDSVSATELFLQMGIDKNEWSNYRTTGFDVNKIDRQKAIDEATIKEFSRYGVLVLLSSNAYSIVEKVLEHIGISISIFQEIICSDRFPYSVPFKKKLAMGYLSDKYGVNFENILSVGDRYSTDIVPMLELGGCGILLKKPYYLRDLIKDLMNNNIASCAKYEYFD